MIYICMIPALLSLSHGVVFAADAANNAASIVPASYKDADYGELYVIQKRASSQRRWQGELAYTYGFSNPYLSIHGADLTFSRKLGSYTRVGFTGSWFTSVNKGVSEQLGSQLGAQGISTTLFAPMHAEHLLFGVTPLSGVLNWFGTSAVDFDFVLTAGAGIARYENISPFLPSFRLSVLPQVMVNDWLGFNAGIQASFERFPDSDWQNRIDTVFGVLGSF